MWAAKTKTELVIEVWEKLDCESIGAEELEAIETVVKEQYGPQAADSPMTVARLLADEGAVLRHAEIMDLHLARAADRPYDAALRNILDVSSISAALSSIRRLESLRKKYLQLNDAVGLRMVREAGIAAKENAAETAVRVHVDPSIRHVSSEIAEWFRVWLQTPQLFEDWASLRKLSTEFKDRFGTEEEEPA